MRVSPTFLGGKKKFTREMEETEEKIKKTLRRLVVTLGWERECGNAQDPVRWGGGGGV